MSKELEALKLIKWKLEDEGILGKEYELCDIIEKALKEKEELKKAFVALSKDDEKAKKLLSKEIEKNRALDIIKKKVMVIQFLILHLSLNDLNGYNKAMDKKHKLTQDEFDFLKKEMLWD